MKAGKLAAPARYHRAAGRHDVADRFEAELWATGRCLQCGRLLKGQRSLNRGYGDDCAARLGLDRRVRS